MAIPHQYPNTKEKVWEGIIQLIDDGRVKTISRVLEELEDNIEYANGAHLRLVQADRAKLLVDWHPFLPKAGEIASLFPRLSPIHNPRTKADTLIIAIAIQYGFIVVHQESRRGRRQNMYAACKQFDVTCQLLGDFVRAENLE